MDQDLHFNSSHIHGQAQTVSPQGAVLCTRNRGLGQLAGTKLDLQVCCCSAGPEVILKAPPAVLQQWEDVDDGQGKQAGASRTPGRLHLPALYDLAPLCSARHVVPAAHMPAVPDYTCLNSRSRHAAYR